MLMPALADKARWEGLMAEQGLASTFTQTEGLAPALPGTATYGNVRVDLNNERLRELIRTEISQMPANADEVWPGVWVGNGKAAQDLQFLLGLGITAVVNMAEGDRTCPVLVDTKLYNKHKIDYHGAKIRDEDSSDISEHFHTTSDIIDKTLTNGGRVLVNCVGGVSRSSTIVLAWLVGRRGIGLEQALTTLRKCREIGPNNGFILSLVKLEEKIKTDQENK